MNKKNQINQNNVTIKYVSHLPDLITYEDIVKENGQKRIKIRIELTENGVEILGDSPFDQSLDDLLIQSGAKEIQKTLCG
ncbi:hypothetical protein MHK_000896 [Candidatus Magnetomorum sp. HK-1]|nr:hypothetical protein MHK_000896 [Candidatus Magnetomorum sp. HK-1]